MNTGVLSLNLGKQTGVGNCDSEWASATLTFEAKYKEQVTKAINKERQYLTDKFVELCQSVVAK